MQLSKHFKLKEFIKSQIQTYPNKMALPKFGVNNYKKQTRKKRKGRISKNLNKRRPRRKKYRGQGR